MLRTASAHHALVSFTGALFFAAIFVGAAVPLVPVA